MLTANSLQRMSFSERSTLIPSRVRREGGKVLEAYLQARDGTPFLLLSADHIPFVTKKSGPAFYAPRLTEAFLDTVIERAGGKRIDLPSAGSNPPKTADYRLGDLVLELKDLQCEGLEVRTRQVKIAQLFSSKLHPDRSTIIDPALLSSEELRTYRRIVGAPVQAAIRNARGQVKATITRVGEPGLAGGVILLNTGYGSMPHDLLSSLAQELVSESTTLQVAICISAWTVTNGFDTVVYFAFDPKEHCLPAIGGLRVAFDDCRDGLMTRWARTGFRLPGPVSDPLMPIVFEEAGSIYCFTPPTPPSSIPTP
jgi:hypothetical protein